MVTATAGYGAQEALQPACQDGGGPIIWAIARAIQYVQGSHDAVGNGGVGGRGCGEDTPTLSGEGRRQTEAQEGEVHRHLYDLVGAVGRGLDRGSEGLDGGHQGPGVRGSLKHSQDHTFPPGQHDGLRRSLDKGRRGAKGIQPPLRAEDLGQDGVRQDGPEVQVEETAVARGDGSQQVRGNLHGSGPREGAASRGWRGRRRGTWGACSSGTWGVGSAAGQYGRHQGQSSPKEHSGPDGAHIRPPTGEPSHKSLGEASGCSHLVSRPGYRATPPTGSTGSVGWQRGSPRVGSSRLPVITRLLGGPPLPPAGELDHPAVASPVSGLHRIYILVAVHPYAVA